MGKQVFDLSGVSNGSYSDAVIYHDIAFISGQMSIDPLSGESKHGSMREQADLVIRNLLLVAEKLGSTAEDVLSVTIYITDESDFNDFDAVYRQYFTAKLPARCTVTVKDLYDQLKIEMTAIVAYHQK